VPVEAPVHQVQILECILLHRSPLFGQLEVVLVVDMHQLAPYRVLVAAVGVVDLVADRQLEVPAHRDKEIMVGLEVLLEAVAVVEVLVLLAVMQLPHWVVMVA
jgi:hypothetical protein